MNVLYSLQLKETMTLWPLNHSLERIPLWTKGSSKQLLFEEPYYPGGDAMAKGHIFQAKGVFWLLIFKLHLGTHKTLYL